jgi:hypothetical protein
MGREASGRGICGIRARARGNRIFFLIFPHFRSHGAYTEHRTVAVPRVVSGHKLAELAK